MSKSNKPTSRLTWVDNTRFTAILLIYVIHVLEPSYDQGLSEVFLPVKYLHTFAIPVFFLISGLFISLKPQSFISSITALFPRRIIPVIFFSLLLLPAHFLLESDTTILDKGVLSIFLLYLSGTPVLNWATWFLVTLFSAELIFRRVVPYASTPTQWLLAAIVLYSAGWAVCEYTPLPVFIASGFWFLREALIVCALIITGYLFKPHLTVLIAEKSYKFYLLLVASTVITLLTFELNHFEGRLVQVRDTVIMSLSQHGNYLLFPLTAISGSVSIILLSALLPANRFMQFYGENTIVLLGVAGFYLHFINVPLAEAQPDHWGALITVLNSILLSIIQIVLCWPIIVIFNRYIPKLIGRWPKK